MIVEVHGMDFWTRVRLPPGPLDNANPNRECSDMKASAPLIRRKAKMQKIPRSGVVDGFSVFLYFILWHKILYLTRQPPGCIPPFLSLAEGVVYMSTYEEFMVFLTACGLLIAILNYTHRK